MKQSLSVSETSIPSPLVSNFTHAGLGTRQEQG